MKKNAILVLSAVLFLVFCANAYAETRIVNKVREAQELLKASEISFETQEVKLPIVSKKTKKIIGYKKEDRVIGKQIILMVWDTDTDEMNEVALRVPHPMPKAGFIFSVLTAGFEVEHISGSTVSKLVFRVWKGGKKLIVLASKHFWIPPELSKSQNHALLSERSKEAIYTPFADDLYFESNDGEEFLYSEIQKALKDLDDKEVMSRAFGGQKLAKVISWELLFNLALNEQMDHTKFKNDRRRTAKEVANEYAFNLANAFRWAVSAANARGAYQFTNKSRRGNTGTYDLVVGSYEDAELVEDFTEGAQDLQNMIKAAACLLDMELAKFPKEVHDLFKKDYRLGSVFPVAAYNEGFGKKQGEGYNGARQLYEWIKKNKFELSLEKEIPQAAFVRYRTYYVRDKQGKLVKATRRIINTETQVYIQKHVYLWQYIDEFKEQLK